MEWISQEPDVHMYGQFSVFILTALSLLRHALVFSVLNRKNRRIFDRYDESVHSALLFNRTNPRKYCIFCVGKLRYLILRFEDSLALSLSAVSFSHGLSGQ